MSKNIIEKNYVSTPFEYTKYSKNLTLLQQSILMKVTERLQEYIYKYFGSELKNSKDVPRPLFSKQDKIAGIPPIIVPYAELGVSANNYAVAHEAVKEILSLTVNALGEDKDGNESLIKYNIFTKANMSSEMKNGVALSLNMEVVDRIFDMSQGYVRHPADITLQAMVERMPMMYYYLQKYSDGWRRSEVDLTVTQLKLYFGLIVQKDVEKEDPETGEMVKTRVTEIKYPKFSKFNVHVLKKSVDDINRLNRDGKINVCVRYEPIYNGKKKVGDPSFIRFYIYNSMSDMKKAMTPEPILFDLLKPGEGEWQLFMNEYQGALKELLKDMPFAEVKDDMIVLYAEEEQEQLFNTIAKEREVAMDVIARITKAYGKRMKVCFKSKGGS